MYCQNGRDFHVKSKRKHKERSEVGRHELLMSCSVESTHLNQFLFGAINDL